MEKRVNHIEQRNIGPPHKIMSAISDDGLEWRPENKVIVPFGSVPEAIYGPDKKVWLFYVDGENCIWLTKSKDGLNFSDERIIIRPKNRDEDLVDPNPVILPNGYIRCYVTHFYDRPKERRGHPKSEFLAFRSKDGEEWSLEEEVRYVDPKGKLLMDPFVVWLKADQYRLYIPGQGMGGPPGQANIRETGIADSIDGGKTFPIQRGVFRGGDVAQVMKMEDRWIMYYCAGGPGTIQYTGIAESKDGLDWKIVKDNGFDGGFGAYVIKLPNRKYRMYYINPKD